MDDFAAHVDIRSFLEVRFSQIITRNQYLFRNIHGPWPSKEQLEALVKKSCGLFIYASTSINFITDGNAPPDARLESVLAMHVGLDPLYKQVLGAVSPQIACFWKVLTALMIFLEQPSVQMLASILHLDKSDVSHALMAIQSIIRIPDDNNEPIQLNHTSLRDFLLSRDRSKDLFVDYSMAHATFATDCVKFLRRNTPENAATFNTVPELLSALQEFSTRAIDPSINIATGKYPDQVTKDEYTKISIIECK
ncbi:hypothetical protein HWV62_32389 [Athelia sp. TMB]|nr:hypothetical protein HWV62_32389 [Athelia sp. TMB]